MVSNTTFTANLDPLPPKSSTSTSEDPPPYSQGQRSNFGTTVYGLIERNSVNKINIQTRHQDVVGTYHIDPDLPIQDSYLLKKSSRSWKRSRKASPNASFRTKSGVIDLNLVITGRTDIVTKANVQLASRSGDIAVNLLSLPDSKHIHLDGYSRSGNIVVLLPKSYRGAIQLRTRKGSLTFLPALANMMKVMNANDDEALVLMGHPSVFSGPDSSDDTDYCQLTTHHGKITVGLSGEDKYLQEPGFWKRLGEKIMGGTRSRQNRDCAA